MSERPNKRKNNKRSVRNVQATSFRMSLLATAVTSLIASHAHGQEIADDSQVTEEVIITGTRSTIQSSIEAKRRADTVTESLSSEDLGDLPELSIGEALETLTSAATHREQGGAKEISIRGMGPYLGSTAMNGRGTTNGSDDSSVNFSQFPSELFNKIEIHKTLMADFHRNLLKGGIYFYPSYANNPKGKLRLLYECNPIAWIAEQAGGEATDGKLRILDLHPTELHQRTPLFVGSFDMVNDVHQFIAEEYI